ncbi:MAG: hypothetical protein COB50_01820 [Thiotrichales bacterium]|nr:MAG: hypothetical protein COB50_01820 [Thiotrichales bacterium]
MQTYAVHMRNPFNLLKEVGPLGFIHFQLILGGSIFANLANLLLWAVLGVWTVFFAIHGGTAEGFFLHNFYESTILRYGWINFFIGHTLLILVNVMVVIVRKKPRLILTALLSPFYWLLTSFASYRVLYQLFTKKPYHWEKTTHGISKLLKKQSS